MAKLSSALVLNKYILNLFGVKDLEALSGSLKDSALEGWDENNVSHFHHALISRFYANENLSVEILYKYDQNIYSHTKAISDNRIVPIRWKYFQYLGLLFSEIYLDKYFSDRNQLLEELNLFLEDTFKEEEKNYQGLTEFTEDSLNKLAFWNATGSGKTLLMHVNILQYQFYLKQHQKERDLNRIIVLTPNEGLSKQHLKEFLDSGMDAELFDKNSGSLFVGQKIEIIDIHKLEETSGDKTVAIEAFEGNNLVLVDEGHRGSGGEIWKGKRNRLCETGFSFEYSATFGQSVSALPGAKQKALIDEYGKSTLFDYSYRYFYGDGYGKDYQILNINETWNEGYVDLYLTACLLSFYEQLNVFRANKKEIEPFLIEKPLAIFVGGKVTAVRTEEKRQVSDVVQVLKFLESFIRNPQQSISRIDRLLQAQDGLNDNMGHSIFRNGFKYLRSQGLNAATTYNDILLEVFNSSLAGAFLHLDNLKGQEGEIGLRIGNADYFGVINVGDDSKLLKLCEEQGIATDEKDFSTSLFHSINSKESKINILIGSKKFSEGWSSWRVSTMGLLNIGRGEGSEIIQLFGRGVRLKGYKFSLKRSSALDYSIRPQNIPAILPLMETLNIFGIRADYMQQFKEYLEEEGLSEESDFENIQIDILPAITGLSEKKLKYLKVKDGVNFKKEVLVNLVKEDKKHTSIILDWYPKIQVLRSSRSTNISTVDTLQTGNLQLTHTAFFDWDKIFFEIEQFKNERSWYNLNLSREDLKGILNDNSWYTLYIPEAELQHNDYSQVRNWQEIGISLLKMFVERIYNLEKQRFYSSHQEVAYLDLNHPNFIKEYNVLVKKSEDRIITKINELKEIVKNKDFKSFQIDQDFEALYFSQHLYFPLLYIENGKYEEVVKIQPVALNKGERDFVNDLKKYFDSNTDSFQGKELYLLRNLSRKGIGFFEANNFYPDFILWLIVGEKQYISFVDPKGLRQIQGLSDPKIQLHTKIREEIEPRLKDSSIQLNSFIISGTGHEQLKHWKGQDSIEDFNEHHVYFQKEQKESYVRLILNSLIEE